MLQLLSRAGRDLHLAGCIIALFILIVACAPAWAGNILDLPVKGGGIFSYGAGELSPRFYGRGIRVGDLSYGGTLPILRGRLDFSGGNFLHSSGKSWFWGPGGSISVRGCADLNHDGRCGSGDFKGTLITGTFLDTEVITQNGKEILEAQIVDQINPQLATLLHLSNSTYRGELELLLANFGRNRWWVHDRIQGGFLRSSGTIPEPPSIWLLGASLVCLGASRFARVLLSLLSRFSFTRV